MSKVCQNTYHCVCLSASDTGTIQIVGTIYLGEGTQGECVIRANEPDTILRTVQIGEYLCYS
jgi:hypothetical protein